MYVLATFILLVVLVSAFLLLRGMNRINNHYKASNQVISNPLMGFAPRADSSEVEDWHQLVYIDVYWSDLEPQKGEFNWAAVEHQHQFERWRKSGKHAVFRFISDYPTKKAHKDIPDWLYEETKDGTSYSNSYGQGYSPNYSNPDFLEAFNRVVEAMGERWGQDSFISYIELGVLGHWGEWHTSLEAKQAGAMPKEDIRDQYVRPWLTAFPNAKILMRRPFNIAAQEKLGLFNDVFGDEYETKRWLCWIKQGGDYDQLDEEDALSSMPKFWQTAPSGGEITSDKSMKELLTSDISATVQMLKDSHTTFLGPKIADKNISESGYNDMLKNMGYRFFIKDVHLTKDDQLQLVIENKGVAPFYWKWPLNFYVETGKHELTIESDFDIRQVLPGREKTITLKLDESLQKNWDKISLGIVDPMTNKDAIHFAIKGMEDKTRLPLISHN